MVDKVYYVEVDTKILGKNIVRVYDKNDKMIEMFNAKDEKTAYSIKQKIYDTVKEQLGEEEFYRRLNSKIDIIIE